MPVEARPLALLAVVFANRFPRRRLQLLAGRSPVLVELATTQDETSRGLSGRQGLRDGEGMLFVMNSSDRHPFWMRNTFVPLSIAFLSEDGTIQEIHDMQPLSEGRVMPARPTRLALEVPQGWFGRRGVAVGDKVTIDR